MKYLILFYQVLFIIFPIYAIGQIPIDKEISFLYYLKVNGADFNLRPYPFASSNLSCLSYYSSEFDKSNFENIKNDEFKRNGYYNQLSKTLKTKIDALSFKKEYYISSLSNFGEYNFSNSSFPITNIFTDCHFLKDKTSLDHECLFTTVPITIGWIINKEYYDYSIKLSPTKAENLINTRKLSNGLINRSLQTKIIFTFVNEPYYLQSPWVDEKDGFIIYVTRIEFYDNGQLLASIKPNAGFEDAVSGYKKLNGEDVYRQDRSFVDYKIVVNRVNGVPTGPVKYYNKNGDLVRILHCSYFFPNKIILSGDEVSFMQYKDKTIPQVIKQYRNNKLNGYNINLYQGNDRIWGNPIAGIYISTVSITDETGVEKNIVKPRDISGYGGAIKDMPNDVQELIKKYDYDNYFSSSITGTSISVDQKNEQKKEITNGKITSSEKKSSSVESTNSKILISAFTGNESKEYLASQIDLYSNKKAGSKEKGNVLFLFNYKDGVDDNIKPNVKDYIVKQFQSWIEKSINITSLELNSLKEDSLFRVELIFTVRLLAITSLDAFIKTRVYITKNGKLVSDETFERSRSLFLESNEPFTVLDNVIKNCEKKITKVLGEYMLIE